MTGDNWERVEALFLVAADLPSEEQARFLDDACNGDTALRAELESLLVSDRKNGEAISRGVGAEAALLFGSDAAGREPHTGDRLGAYRVLREIGRGGMGAVYLATRDDDQYRKQVAIKVVKRGMDTVDVLGRFRHERQILANLDHPYIARLLDGGTTPDGRPFFVMDHVEGVPVDVFCRGRGLDVAARCELFLKICEAVSHAHRNLVVHRDLKPGNIFVTSDGTPKLLDFGVAKLLVNEPGEGVTATQAMRPFTPDYASPEQVRGLTVTTATDVYSLGAILYELLTGERAQPVTGTTPLEIDRAVCEREVGKPSAVARGLDEDLDNIVLMAMRKEPERRYASVDQLAEDVRRYLDGRPVIARQDSFAYRGQKFLRRNRTAVAAGAVFIVVLVAGATVSLLEARRANRERAVADRRFEQVRQLAGKFLLDFHDSIAKLPGSTAARKMVVETGLQYYDTLVKEAQGNRDLLEEIARGYDRLGDVQGNPYYPNLGDTAGALASYRKALELRKGIADPAPEFLADLIRGEVKIAQMQTVKGDIKAADGALKAAIDLGEHAPAAAEYKVRAALANAYTAYGDLKIRQAEHTRGVEPYLKALALSEQLARENRDPVAEQIGVSLAHTKLGEIYTRLERGREAMEQLRLAVAIDEKLAHAEPANTARMRKLYIDNVLLGFLFRTAGESLAKPGEAQAAMQSAIGLAEGMAAADPNNTNAFVDIMQAHGTLADWLRKHGGLAEALPHYQTALSAAERYATSSAPELARNDALVQSHQRLGQAFGEAGRLEEALAHFRQSEDFLARMEKANPGLVRAALRRAEISDSRAQIYKRQKKWTDAIASFETALAIFVEQRRRDPQADPYLNAQPALYSQLADCHAAAQQWGAAIGELQSVLDRLAEIASRRALNSEETKLRDDAGRKLAEWKRRHAG